MLNRESSIKILKDLKEAAILSGVYDKMFLGFGTLLGCVRERSLIEHDTDLDVCFLPLKPEEKQRYFDICTEKGLRGGWVGEPDRIATKPDGELLWFSAKSGLRETKCCNWFFEDWNNILWHTKGKIWVSDEHFYGKYKPGDVAIMKGAPEYLFELCEIHTFAGKFNVPVRTGELLDFWYPNWYDPKYACESCFNLLCRVGDWNDRTTWKII